MNDSAAALRPLDEAAPAIDRLHDYESIDALASAVQSVRDAVEMSLRRRLRGDASAPEHDRLAALSPRDISLPDVIRSLRTRDLISLEAAGTVHELEAAAERARAGGSRAADADLALRAVSRLRSELGEAQPAPVAEVAVAAPAARRDPNATDPRVGRQPERRGQGMAWLGSALAALIVGVLATGLVVGGAADYDDAVTAFRAGRLDSAAVAFERVLVDRPSDVNALLYLGRIYRRQGRHAESARVLREAAGIAPSDADIRRELGHLFMDLGQPRAAVEQYERALESDAEETRTWAALIGALRAAGDPRAERMLAEAPPDVQALLGRPES